MSEHIVHTCVAEDTVRLASASARFAPAFRDAIRDYAASAPLGGISKRGDACVPLILRDLRAIRESGREWDVRDGEHLAIAVGWLSHRAADRQMKPVFRAAHPDHYAKPKHERRKGPTDCSIYHDAFIYRRRYADGAPPFHRDLVASDRPDAEALEDLAHLVLRRSLIQIHTVIPDEEHPRQWLDRFLERQQRFPVELARYAKAILHPTPEEDQRYLAAFNFYDPEDPIVALAERLQAGGTASGDEIDGACEQTEGSSCYARILIRAMGYLEAADTYLQGAIDLDEYKRRQDVGRPEIDMDLVSG